MRLMRIDAWLLIGVAGLLGMGVIAVASTGASRGVPLTLENGPGLRQVVLACLGLVTLTAAASLDYRWLKPIAPFAYLGTVALLVAVLGVGIATHGSRRWLEFGALSFQPSEVAKIALVIALAALLANRDSRGLTLALSMALAGLVALLVLVEPDTGSTLVVGLAWFALAIAARIGWHVLGGLLATALGVVPLAFALAVPAYQRERLAVFLDPTRDPLGSGFNVRQAEIAIGSGGLWGNGVFDGWRGTESALTHVAARASDFVFAQVAEDLGLAGTLTVVAFFGLIAWRGYRVARAAPDEFGRLLAAGLTSIVVGQGLVHMAVNLRLFPATGITLPFVSAGGTSLLVTCGAIGLIESVASHRGPGNRLRRSRD